MDRTEEKCVMWGNIIGDSLDLFLKAKAVRKSCNVFSINSSVKGINFGRPWLVPELFGYVTKTERNRMNS